MNQLNDMIIKIVQKKVRVKCRKFDIITKRIKLYQEKGTKDSSRNYIFGSGIILTRDRKFLAMNGENEVVFWPG
jgi:hypothetical protein